MQATIRWSGCALLSAGFMFTQAAGAAGFALAEQNASALGNSYAGVAATAEDASTVFFNPAGMTRLSSPSAVVALTAVDLSSKFSNRASQNAFGQSLGGDGGNAGDTSLVPAAYFSMPLVGPTSVGIGVNAPFGLKTEYDDDWIGRFQALKSEVKTLNVNPSFAMKFNDVISLGVGADYQQLQAELTNAVNYTAVIGAVNPALVPTNMGLQGKASIRGDDTAWGYDLGLLFQLSPQTRLGVTYRSALKYHVEGTATLTAPTTSSVGGTAVITAVRASQAANGLADGPISLDIKLPASARLSLSQGVGDQLELLADVSWTQWSSVQQLRVVRSNGVTLQLTPENWENSWRYAVGANFALNDAWKLRAGLAYDKTPVPDSTRTPRLPDEDRKWISIGAQWHLSPSMSLDASYAHLIAADASLNQNAGSASAYGLLNGEQQSNINLLGVQLSVNF